MLECLGAKFQPRLRILIFWTKCGLKSYFKSKTEKVNITIEFCIFELVQLLTFTLNKQFSILEPKSPKMGTSGLKQKK